MIDHNLTTTESIQLNQKGTFDTVTINLTITVFCEENFGGPDCTQCVPGLTGSNCNETDHCFGVNCSGNGECMSVGVECSGNGQCVDGVNNFTCQCTAGFSGRQCSESKFVTLIVYIIYTTCHHVYLLQVKHDHIFICFNVTWSRSMIQFET